MPVLSAEVCLAAIALITDPKDFLIGTAAWEIKAKRVVLVRQLSNGEAYDMTTTCSPLHGQAQKFTCLGAVVNAQQNDFVPLWVQDKIIRYYREHAPNYRLALMGVAEATALMHRVALEAIMTLCID